MWEAPLACLVCSGTFVRAAGAKLFLVVDHSGEARRVGMTLRDTTLLVFGNPVVGTPAMVASPLVALDLPPKVLLWMDDDGAVWMSYLDAAWLPAMAWPPVGARQPDRRGRNLVRSDIRPVLPGLAVAVLGAALCQRRQEFAPRSDDQRAEHEPSPPGSSDHASSGVARPTVSPGPGVRAWLGTRSGQPRWRCWCWGCGVGRSWWWRWRRCQSSPMASTRATSISPHAHHRASDTALG
jgi:Domain of unknown function DUF302